MRSLFNLWQFFMMWAARINPYGAHISFWSISFTTGIWSISFTFPLLTCHIIVTVTYGLLTLIYQALYHPGRLTTCFYIQGLLKDYWWKVLMGEGGHLAGRAGGHVMSCDFLYSPAHICRRGVLYYREHFTQWMYHLQLNLLQFRYFYYSSLIYFLIFCDNFTLWHFP